MTSREAVEVTEVIDVIDVIDVVTAPGKDLAFVMASAGLLILSQPPYESGFIAAVALVPWLSRIRRASAPGAFAMGLLFGVLFAIGAANWIFDALAAQGSTGFRSVVAAVLIAVWAKGLLFAAVGWVVNRLQARGPPIAILVPALLFGLGEFWMGHSAWGLPLLLLGHSQISVPGVAQLAAAVGVPGLSSMLFALNLSLASVAFGESSGRRFTFVIGSIWLIAIATGVPLARVLSPEPLGQPRRILVVQPDLTSHDRWESAYQDALLEEIAVETSRAIAESREPPDVILWPESLLTFSGESGGRPGRRLQRHIDDWGIPVVLGLVRGADKADKADQADEVDEAEEAKAMRAVSGERRVPGAQGAERAHREAAAQAVRRHRYINSVVWWSPIRGPIASRDKARAIPVVESSRRFPGQGILDWLIARGADGPRVVEAVAAEPLKGEFTLTAALCFEILFPSVVADRRDEETLAIVNLADDSWVAGEVLDAQLIAAGAFRAIEQGLTMIRVSHGGLSVAVDRFGKTIASLPPDRVGHMTIEVVAHPRLTRSRRAAALLPSVVSGLANPVDWRWVERWRSFFRPQATVFDVGGSRGLP